MKRKKLERRQDKKKRERERERERERFFWKSVPTLLFAVQKDTRASYT